MSGYPNDPTSLERFALKQRLSMMTNRFEVRAGGADGPLLAVAQQKRLAMREQVTFFADEDRSQPLFGFKARSVMDLGTTYDVTDGAGAPIGWFKKEFGQSMLRSTFSVGVPHQGLEGSGQERSQLIALLRRFSDFSWPVHFDFTAGDVPIMSIERQWSLRDAYDVQLPAAPHGARMDWRVAACLAVGCDVLLSR
ncbi:LURP-one-related/scramblase family protein [Auraticoccus monumenti]|uniref:Uncharacterized protein n=1 Tax=Auraticoccus monumenti TaxID=675864 RepID=A0A1G6S6I5_9ACTN|nr:hypothetical protein [Auraticoccus monumenti]SDD12542.1 hypothetical protein SAMN04489747_0240 [Auraticoccus monumenti]